MNIPGYQIDQEIGHGGMATVYLAIQDSLNRPVALKVMASALAADRNFSERFSREAHTVGKLNHPNIVAIYDVGVVDHNHYIAMEYVDGGDLKQRQKSGEISVDEALKIISQIASALGYAHNKGFVHRDIKPENILFREDGSVVLSDFGIAKAVDSSTRMTGTGMSIGTPHYMSPEQAQGKAEIDGRSDLYSLGIMLYEMLTGKVPYEADNTIGVAMQHVQAPVPELPSNLSKYQPLLDHLLAKQAKQRYQSANELIHAIDQLKSGTLLQRPMHATRVMASNEVVSSDNARNISARNDGLKWGVGGAFFAVFIVTMYYGLPQPLKITINSPTINPFSELSAFISPAIMQLYIIVMLVIVVGGIIIYTLHKKSVTYTNEVVPSGKFSYMPGRILRFFIVSGFVIFVVSTITLIFLFPMVAAADIWPILWHLGTVLMCVGGLFWFFISVDTNSEGKRLSRMVIADIFIVSLLLTGTFGLLWSLSGAGLVGLSLLFFVVFFIANTALFTILPWSKFAHMFYKTAAERK